MRILNFIIFAFISFGVVASENALQLETRNIIKSIYGKTEIPYKDNFTNCNKAKLLDGQYQRAPLCLKLNNSKINQFTVIVELTDANTSRLVGTFKVSSGFSQLELPINTLYLGGEGCLGRKIKIVVISKVKKETYMTIMNEWLASSCDYIL